MNKNKWLVPVLCIGIVLCLVFLGKLDGIREGTCAGGMLTVSRQAVRILASSFDWKE